MLTVYLIQLCLLKIITIYLKQMDAIFMKLEVLIFFFLTFNPFLPPTKSLKIQIFFYKQCQELNLLNILLITPVLVST